MQHKFDVYFAGETLEGQDEQKVKQTLGQLFKLSGDKLEALFSGKPIRIKKDQDVAQSGKLRKMFREAGALVHIVPAGQPYKKQAPRAVADTPDLWSLMPAGADLNPLPRDARDAIKTGHNPSGDNLTMAPVSPLPAKPEPPPAQIDTANLQAAPANSGSLEEFAKPRPAAPIPDISQLQVASSDKPLQAENRAQAEPLPDISHLQAEPARTGSLEQYAQEKTPVPIPDIDKLSLEN